MKICIKIIALIFLLTLLIQPVGQICASAESELLYQKEYELICQLKLFDAAGDYNADDIVSGEKLNLIFKDITGRDINGIYQGLEYVPQVKFVEGVKILIDALGYEKVSENEGGYPLGHLTSAARLCLFRNMQVVAGEPLTYRTLSKLIYNALPIEIYKAVSVGEGYTEYKNDGTTFMEHYLEISKITGKLDGINKTTAPSRLYVSINGTSYTVSPEFNAVGLVGRYVEAYYSDDADYDIIAISANDKYDTFVIPLKEMVSYENDTFYYENGIKISKLTVNSTVDVYKNGSLLTTYSNEDFTGEYGEITFVEGPSGDFESVIVMQYKDFVVSGAWSENYTFYNEISEDENEKSLSLDPDSDVYLNLMDVNGNIISYADIAVGDVLSVAKSDDAVSVVRSNKRVNGFNISYIENNEGTVIGNGAEQYILSEYYLKYTSDAVPELLDTVNLYLNSFGDVAYLSYSASEEFAVGYLLASDLGDNVAEELLLKILMTNSKIEVFKCSDKVTIEGSDGVSSRCRNSVDAYNKIGAYKGLISYRADADGKVCEILIPLIPPADAKDRLNNRIYAYQKLDGVSYTYNGYTSSFSNQVYYRNGETVIFTIPTDTSNHEQYYAFTTSVLQSGQGYPDFEGYTYGKNEFTLRAVVINNYDIEFTRNDQYFVVTKITDAISDGEQVKLVTGYQNGNKVSYTIPDSGFAVNNMSNPFKNLNGIKAEVGDIIRVCLNPRTNKVEKAEILYDCSAVNPAFPDGQLGNISGSTGTYNSTVANSNPYGMYDFGQSVYTGQKDPSTGHMRFIYGWVLEKYDNYVTITTQDLSSGEYDPALNHDGVNVTDGFVTETHVFGKFSNGMTVSYVPNRDIIVSAKSIDSVRDYKNSGADCSRVIVYTRQGQPMWWITLNND